MKRLIQLSIVASILWFAFLAGATSLAPQPKFTALDSNGDPWVGALLYTYETGTTTPKETWTDFTKSTPNTNPIVLDSYGQASVWLDSSGGAYRLKLLDPEGNTIWTVDSVHDATSGLVQGAITNPVKADEFLVEESSSGLVKTLTLENLNGNVYYPDYNEVDQGVDGSGSTIKTFVDSIGTDTEATIVLRHNSGGDTTEYVFSTDETIPSNITVKFARGAIISPDSGVTITFESEPEAERYQIFSLPESEYDNIYFSEGGTVYPEWFGAVGDPGTALEEVVDDYQAIQSALNSLSNGVLDLDAKVYALSDTLVWPFNAGSTTYLRQIKIQGKTGHIYGGGPWDATRSMLFFTYATEKNGIELRTATGLATTAFTGCGIKDVDIHGRGYGIGINAYSISNSSFENVMIRNFDKGMKTEGNLYYGKINKCEFMDNTVGFYSTGLHNGFVFKDCNFSDNTDYGFQLYKPGSSDFMSFKDCYFESNGKNGVKAANVLRFQFDNCYFEDNLEGDIDATSTLYLSGVISIKNCHFHPGYDSALKTTNMARVISENNYYSKKADSGYVLDVGLQTQIISVNDRYESDDGSLHDLQADTIHLNTQGYPTIRHQYRQPYYNLINNVGDVTFHSTNVNNAPGYPAMFNTMLGGKGPGAPQLTGHTGTTEIGSNFITLNSWSPGYIFEGATIAVAGVTWGSAGNNRVLVRRVDTVTPGLVVAQDAQNAVSGAAITYPDALAGSGGPSLGQIFASETLDDDEVLTTWKQVSAGISTGVAIITCKGSTEYSGVAFFDATSGAESVIIIGGGTGFEVGTGAHTGTTGSDAKLTFAVRRVSGSVYFYVENRTGSEQTVAVKVPDGL